MDIFKKLIDLCVEINDIYLELCRESIKGLDGKKIFLDLVAVLKENML